MNTRLLAFPALAAALVVSACSSTTNPPPPPPEPSPLTYSALRVTPTGVQSGTGTITGSPTNATVTVGNATYTMTGNGVPDDTYGGVSVYSYPAAGNRDGAFLLTGQQSAAAAVADNSVNGQSVFVLNGNETSPNSMPTQSANYDGLWTMSASDGTTAAGQFEANVNFDNRNLFIDLYDGNIPVGSGAGRVQGTGFTSSLTTQGAFASSNNIDGQFYGSGAQDMGGLISGNKTTNNAPTAGALLGTKQ